MNPILGRRRASDTSPFRGITALALAAGLSLAQLASAWAQHSMHHGHSAGAGKAAPDQPAVAAFKAAHERMMRNMDMPFTGDPDVDFRMHMIPHHQGAIDMAEVAMRYAKNPWTRQLAESVIIEQQREIAEMQAWLAQHGAAVPTGPQRQQVIRSTWPKRETPEAGTLDESRAKSWAPSSGVPAAR